MVPKRDVQGIPLAHTMRTSLEDQSPLEGPFSGWLKARTQAAFKVDAVDDVDAADNMQTAELRIDVEGGNGVFSNSSFANTLKRKRPSSSGKTAQKPSKRGTRAEKENGRVDEDGKITRHVQLTAWIYELTSRLCWCTGMDTSDVDLIQQATKLLIQMMPRQFPFPPNTPLRGPVLRFPTCAINHCIIGVQVHKHAACRCTSRCASAITSNGKDSSFLRRWHRWHEYQYYGPTFQLFFRISRGTSRSQHTLPAQGLTASLQIPILPEVAALDGQVERTVAAPSTADNSDDAMGFRGLTVLAIAAGRRGTEIGNTIGERAIVSGERQLSGGPPGTLHETTGAAAPAFATGSTFSNHAPTTGPRQERSNEHVCWRQCADGQCTNTFF